MIALLRVELTRLRWRRAVLCLLAAAVVVPIIILAATAYGSRPVSDSEQRYAEEQAAREASQPYVQDSLDECVRDPDSYGVPPDVSDTQAACEEMVLPQPEWYLYRQPLDLVDQRESGSGFAVAVLLAMLSVLLGTTFVGHDWSSGSMSNQLLFEPRRLRVWAAKALAVTGLAFVTGLVVMTAYWTGLVVTAHLQDAAIADHAVSAAYKQAVLGAGLAAGGALLGYALTMLFRSTVASLGTLFAFSVAGTVVVATLGIDGLQRVLPTSNIGAYLTGSFTYYTDFGQRPETIHRSDSVIYLVVLMALVSLPSILSYLRRDVP